MLCGLALGLLAWIPIPNAHVFLPGPALSTAELVEVDGFPRPPVQGEFYITTLYQRPATTWWALRALIQTDWTLVRGSADPPHALQVQQPDPEHDELRKVVYQTCGLEPKPAVTIIDTTEDSPLKNKVQPGDQLVAVNELPVHTVRQLRGSVGQVGLKGTVHLLLRRSGGSEYRVDCQPRAITGLHGQPGLGLRLARSWDQRSMPPIYFKAGSYQGNSSDLMLALDLCERLLGSDIRRGRRIAGSGGLNGDGVVTSVQGLRQKLASASKVKAEIFLVPRQDLKQLDPPPAGAPKVVGVRSLNEAIDYLQGKNGVAL